MTPLPQSGAPEKETHYAGVPWLSSLGDRIQSAANRILNDAGPEVVSKPSIEGDVDDIRIATMSPRTLAANTQFARQLVLKPDLGLALRGVSILDRLVRSGRLATPDIQDAAGDLAHAMVWPLDSHLKLHERVCRMLDLSARDFSLHAHKQWTIWSDEIAKALIARVPR